ncbi:filamentous haemagglutinin family protein [Novosphingobium sp.]|uniref:filamentous haemagglutinin family protein n=1 Tax=Novosphingobium sp. TaxID=1874826 RepID=UPI003BAAC18A
MTHHTARAAFSVRALLGSVSGGALVLGIAMPQVAHAQLAQIRANAGTVTVGTVSSGPTSGTLRSPSMQAAVARQQALQDRAKALAGYVTTARSAALASIRKTPTDGISDKGLNPIAPVRAATLYVAAGASTTTIKANAVPDSVSAAKDPTGVNTWEGASAPVQTTDSAGKVTVTIDQSQSRALLTWRNFDVSSNTSLVFNQKQNGVSQKSWSVVNRVVDAKDPSVILGSIKADGTVLILNGAGVLFGPNSQVNLHSLVASSLELGNFASGVTAVGQKQFFVASSIKDRNTAYLQNGLLLSGVSSYKAQFLSALLPSGLYDVTSRLPVPSTLEGDVAVYGGAQITADSGGMVVLAGPTVVNAGVINASDGQVSLQGGRLIGATTSTGAAGSADQNVRGLIFSTQTPSAPSAPSDSQPDQGSVVNFGLISSRRGYLSLGAGVFGTVENTGLLSATTSVSRNGKIALIAGSVTLTGSDDLNHASGITITPDDNGETIPQGSPGSPPNFKTSQLTVGASISSYLAADGSGDVALLPSIFHMERNAFVFAPGAKVVIGHDAALGNFAINSAVRASVTIDEGAIIDVSGLKDVSVDASRNAVTINPAKRNELRDTPNYRELSADGRFTLNGEKLVVDPRISGVRSDGVAWVGSPLLEAASATSQIPVTAAELLTKGGTISIDIGAVTASNNLDASTLGAINIARGALFDISGGWTSYKAGFLATTRLITSDGRIVAIADADPNDSYVGVADGFTVSQPRTGTTDSFGSAVIAGGRFEAAYDEGRDAGALMVVGSQIAFDGTVKGDAFAGANQIAAATEPTGTSSIDGDPRKLQKGAAQLPAGGLFRIGAFSGSSDIGLGQDIAVNRGGLGGGIATLALDADMLRGAGLSALMLQTSGRVSLDATLRGDAALTLVDGGILAIDAGRSITLDGDVRIAGGRIAARTYALSSVFAAGIGTVGNPFRSDDDISLIYASADDAQRLFDLTVTGKLSTAGRWVNDFAQKNAPLGAAWINGGSISLTVAPRVFVPVGASASAATRAVDLSGSLTIAGSALLDVSAGGYVSAQRRFRLDAAGGDITLRNETTYASVVPILADPADSAGGVVQGQGVSFTPLDATPSTVGVTPALVPAEQRSVVSFSASSLRGFGFSGGGAFNLISPDVVFGTASGSATATRIGLDFLQQTGFGTLGVTTYHSRLVSNLFDNGSTGLSAFFDTTSLTIGKGETLDLTQVTLPTVLESNAQQRLLTLASGGDLFSVLQPVVPVDAWYRKAANLKLGGLIELDVLEGGSITGAVKASIVTPKLFNAGSIVLHGGSITQEARLPSALDASGIGLVDKAQGGSGFDAVFGAADAQGRYRLDALNTAGLTNADGSVQTNNQIFTTPGAEHFLYFVGKLGASEGVELGNGSVTDLSGAVLYDPTAPLRSDGSQYRFGKLFAGGSLTTAAAYRPQTDTSYALFENPAYGFPAYPDPTSASPNPPPQLANVAARTLVARPGAMLDISGISATLDVAVSAIDYAPSLQWSNGGTLALRGGGSLSGAIVRANGGTAQATGGTLAWLRPVIQAADDGRGLANVAFADGIERAGFSSLIAYGGLTLDGKFTLSLGKSLLVQSAPRLNEDAVGTNAAVAISATRGTDATISAPYIAFASRSGAVQASTAATGDGKVRFSAGASGIDVLGSVLFGPSIASTRLDSVGDVRLIGVDDRNDRTQLPVLNGSVVSAGDLTFDAARVYTATGAGNLQRILEGEAAGTSTAKLTPYLISALGSSSITFLGDHINKQTPLSAGSYLRITANKVFQDGFLAAPLGRIEFGTSAAPIDTLVFGAGSITTVSAGGQKIPYGTTTDLKEYFFTAGSSSPITVTPSGELRLTGNAITVQAGGLVDGSGGGDIFAYEFVSGTGGSRDVLSRFNTDAFSSNDYDTATGTGYQYADHRQVYALVPADTAAKIAFYDPIYSADYVGGSSPTNLYGSDAGLAVTLDGGSGIAAGQYVLMPAHYALLPGAYRIVENTDTSAPAAGASQVLRDGSIVMGGTYSTAGTALAESARRSFTIMSHDTVLTYSRIETTSGSTSISDAANSAGKAAPRLALDAARVVLAPLSSLKVEGTFNMAPGTKGRGAEVDILGRDIIINHSGEGDAGSLVLSDTTLAKLNAASLLIGATRQDNTDDTTTLNVFANRITVGASTRLTVPEVIFAVGGRGARLTFADGAKITATGTLSDTRAGDYLINSGTAVDPTYDQTGIGSILRLSGGPERLVARVGTVAAANTNRLATLDIGAASLTGASLLMETSRNLTVDDGAQLEASRIALVGDALSFGTAGGIGAKLEAKLAAADSLTLRSSAPIAFLPGSRHVFRSLTLDTPAVALAGYTGGRDTLTLVSDSLRLTNSSGKAATCSTISGALCGSTGNVLTIETGTLTLGSGTLRPYSFDGGLNLTASKGIYYSGKGKLDLGSASLTLVTPFIVDRAAVVDLTKASAAASDTVTPAGNYTIPVTPDYTFATTGAVGISAPVPAAGAAVPTATGIRAPGAHLTFGGAGSPVDSLTVDGTQIAATAGVIDAQTKGAITLSGSASLATVGFSRTYGDSTTTTTVSAGGGTVNLVSLGGGIVLGSAASISIDNGIGNAGRLNLLASNGAIAFGATLNPGVTGSRLASLTFDAGQSAFDLDGFAQRYGTLFGGDIAIRAGKGDMTLAGGHRLKAGSISLTADGGSIVIGGTLDTSGADLSKLTAVQAAQARVNGGDIALWGMAGVTLQTGALLDTHSSGYADTDSRQASAGDVTIGIGNTGGAITIADGAKLDLSATRTVAANADGRTGNRLLPRTVKDPSTLVSTTVYDFVAADTGGNLTLRAPVFGANDDKIDLRLHGLVSGAQSVSVEGYKTYNLDEIGTSGLYSGVIATPNAVFLDTTPDGNNILSDVFKGADGTASIPWFIQHFGVSAVDGSSLAGMRLRPGVDLVSATDIALTTNWNLAAGTVNVAKAIADGLMTEIPELGPGPGNKPYYAVVAGQEGNLLENYTAFLYRVGAKASGEAGVISLRAGGGLDIAASISDGFFTFADKSDPTWINYQLGGGDRTYNPALLLSCGTTLDCKSLANFTDVSGGNTAANADNTLVVALAKFYQGAQQGDVGVAAPYIGRNNDVTATGYAIDPNTGELSGDALGFAQLFPLLSDGSAIRSTSLRFAAGAGTSVSANPLHVDHATNANIIVEGEKSYALTATQGSARIGTGVNLTLAVPTSAVGAGPVFTLDNLLGQGGTGSAAAAGLASDTYTTMTWGTGAVGAASELRSAAQAYFGSSNATFVRNSAGVITGVAAPLGAMLGFLNQSQGLILEGIKAGTGGYPTGTLKAPTVGNYGSQVAYTHSLVRTGDGSIDLAASGNIDLRGGADAIYRTEKGVTSSVSRSTNAQVGGTAIYTAGHRVAASALLANVIGTNALMRAPVASPYQSIAAQDGGFIPSPKGFDEQAAVFATGGGRVTLDAGGSILGRRDVWSETFLGSGASLGNNLVSSFDVTQIGDSSQRWRPGVVGQDTEIAIAPKYFTSGVGALAGGDVTLRAGADVSDLTVALDSAVTTATASTASGTSTALVQVNLGSGDLDATIGGNLAAGQIDVATGRATISVGGSVTAFGEERISSTSDDAQYLRLRTSGSAVTLSALGDIALAGVSALGAWRDGNARGKYDAAGFFTPEAAFSAVATGSLRYIGNRVDQTVPFQIGAGNAGIFAGHVLTPHLSLAALEGDLTMPALPLLLYPAPTSNLQLFSAGNLSSLVIAMSDSDPSLLPGAFSAAEINLDSLTASGSGNVTALAGLGFGLPGVDITTSDTLLRLYHNEASTHAGDHTAAEIYAGGDIANSVINLAKQARITAGRDIVNLYFTGQNTSAADTTTITAGRDILGTTTSSASANLPYIVSSNFLLGGPGTFQVQAGRDIGPFINSATIDNISYAGGIQTVGNDANPWLAPVGADLSVLFGVGKGINYDGLTTTYLNPANAAKLDGALFVQVTDELGNDRPDWTKPIYAPILATWLRSHAPDAFAAIFGSTSYPDTTDGNAALAAAAYGRMTDLYTAFQGLDPLLQHGFLVKELFYNELQRTPSIRAYRAIDTLFPAAWGYTDNLAQFTTDQATVNADHPLGQPVRKLADGQPVKANQIVTGSIDLRLATLETTRGGDITILGPGGNFIGGSVVRTSEQAARRVSRFGVGPTSSLAYGQINNTNVRAIDSIPIGYEGVLSLRGGKIYSFTDGSFLVNQSRVFSVGGGNIVMFSSNGDLNAGQGPRSASNFPPVTVRFNLDGYAEVDSAGSVSGAGIGAFKPTPDSPASSVSLIAPVGTVDAGDAGVRASGDVVVIAARVANADAISSSSGSISGVPASAPAAVATPAGANAAATAQSNGQNGNGNADKRSIITVEVRGFAGSDPCDDPNDPNCKTN